MDKAQASIDIISHALPLVPFEGWSMETLARAAAAAGYKETDIIRVFPGGAAEAVDVFLRMGDAKMIESLKQYNLETMKIRERIATAVRLRIEADAAHREAVRKTAAMETLRPHRAVPHLYRTADAIWRAAGDTSTDFNFYTKRLILGAVYSSTLLYWLNDKTPRSAATWEFLARRIENVMAFEKTKQKLRGWWQARAA